MIDTQLVGKTVLITGANHGIGAATAVAFAAQGARVFVAYYRGDSPYSTAELVEARRAGIGGDRLYRSFQQQDAEEVLANIASVGGQGAAHEADLSDVAQIPALFDLCEDTFGPVDILVNNHTHCVLETFDPAQVRDEDAGVFLVSMPEVDAHHAVNVRATVLLMREYVERFLGHEGIWGRIVNVSTDAAHAHPENVSYAASKHAIESYSRSAAVELGKYGVTVNIVAPGPIQTGYIPPETETEIAGQIPLRRIGRPKDVADVIVFLASEQARWMTGQLLYVGGGWRVHQ